MAIAWEESMFNNQEQIGGTAWGFGQVEPSEYYKLQGPQAAYPVQGLPSVRHYEVKAKGKDGKEITLKKARLQGSLTDQQSIQVEISSLMHGYKALGSKMASLRAYAGIGYAGPDVPDRLSDAGKRQHIIDGWLACETHLQKGWNAPPPPPPKGKKAPSGLDSILDYSAFLKEGLAKAKGFDRKDPVIDDILFPKNYTNEAGKRIWWPNPRLSHAHDMIAADMKSRGLL
jgi:hypothetical protein